MGAQENGSDVVVEARQVTEDDCSVCVAVHIRPLIDAEKAEGCQHCLSVAPGQPQVFSGASSFTYDHVFGGGGVPPADLYENCVLPLVSGLFRGYNATVFAYGQTGSGKTYTMGSAFTPGGSSSGVIVRVMDTIFNRISSTADTEFTVRVGFVEIHTEEIRDLLVMDSRGGQSVHIREVPGGGVCLAGATEKEVTTKAEMAELLGQGTLQRATASTGMNKQSSRSHAIFTITVEQRRKLLPSPRNCRSDGEDEGGESGDDEGCVDDYLCAKMHLVDLAGSERTKRTKAEGQRLKEGININKGLLALGNVISALSEGKSHVPYRDSKLTRMLQDSLGGNSRTVMIACVSPADVNLEESLNTLRYANRARNIKNKPVVNRDPNAAQLAHLRQQLGAARSEIGALRRRLGDQNGDQVPWVDPSTSTSDEIMAAALDELQLKVSRLDLDNARLRVELETARQELRETAEQLLQTQAERDRKALRVQQLSAERVASGGAAEPSSPDGEQMDVVQGHLRRIAALEQEVKRLKQVQRASGAYMVSARKQARDLAALDRKESAPGTPMSPLAMPDLTMAAGESLGDEDEFEEGSNLEEDEEFAAESHAHRVEQQRVASELENLQRVLDNKEAQMARMMSGDGQISALKQHYDRVLTDLQSERDQLQKERTELMQRMQNLDSSSKEERLSLEAKYRERLREMDRKLKEVRMKERKYAHIERLQARSQQTCDRLQTDIQSIKQQKVQLMRQMESSAKEFQQWRKQRERELMTLRRQGMKNAAHVQRLEALQQKQQAVLRRKTEEAEAARKRLKELMDVHKSANETRKERAVAATPRTGTLLDVQPNNTAPLLRDEKSRKDWVEHELDMCCQSFELQRVLDGEKAQRSEAARQLKELEQRAASTQAAGGAPEVAEYRQKALQEQIQRHSDQILETQQLLMKCKAEEEQKGQGAADVKRWNGLRSVAEARVLLKTVFRVATAQKAQVYESQTELTEAREELDLLRLKLEVAEQEAAAAKRSAAAAQSAVAAAMAHATTPRKPSPPSSPRDETENMVESLMEAISEAGDDEEGDGRSRGSSDAESATPRSQALSEGDYLSAPESDDSDDGEDGAWDPQNATPWRAQRARRRSDSAHASFSLAEGDEARMKEETEIPVLMAINRERSRQGLSPTAKLTVSLLCAHLKGKLIAGQEWRRGNKTRPELLQDFREYLNLPERKSPGKGGQLPSLRVHVRQPPAEEVGGADAASQRQQISFTDFKTRMASQYDAVAAELDSLSHRTARLSQGRSPYGSPMAQDTVQPADIQASAADKRRDTWVGASGAVEGLRAQAEGNAAVDSPVRGGIPGGKEPTTPGGASFYIEVREQCQAAMKRATALKEKMNGTPAASGARQLLLPPLNLPAAKDSSRGGPGADADASDQDDDRGHPAAPPPLQLPYGSSESNGGSQPGSPARSVLGDIANSGESLSRSFEKPPDSVAVRQKRPQAAHARGGGPLSARHVQKSTSSFVSPRPKAAWL